MKIGVNCYILRSNVGGIKEYFISLFEYLLLNDKNNEYIFFYFDHNLEELARLSDKKWQENGILLENQNQVSDHLDKMDLYFCPFGTLWPRPLPLPTVVTLVDIQEKFYPEFFTVHNLIARAYHYRGSTIVADRIVTISDFSRQSIVKFHHIPKEKIEVAYLCADEKFYRATDVATRPEQKLPDKYLFFPANRWKHKNHDILLQSLQLLKDKYGRVVQLVLTGFDAENGYPVSEKAEEFGIAEQVHQLGYLSVDELCYLYVNARALVFPSLFEGFGIPLVDRVG